MERLTWADLLIEDFTPDQFLEWISPWGAAIGGVIAPVFVNKFGFLFFRRPSGAVEVLNAFTGRVEPVAPDEEQFIREVDEPWWQEIYLLSELVYELHGAGKVPGAGQCYALAPHPALGGPNPISGDAVDPRCVMVMDVAVWLHICAQSAGSAPAAEYGGG